MFESAREARAFGRRLTEHFEEIKAAAEATTRSGRLLEIEPGVGCYGPGNLLKLAEIVAATVLCEELSLGSAVVAHEWVAAHYVYGRNRL